MESSSLLPRVAFFSSKAYDKTVFAQHGQQANIEFVHIESKLDNTTLASASGFSTICIFVNDVISADTAKQLATMGVKHIALRCAGYNNVDIASCRKLGISVSHVPAYSPHSVAEHAMALILTLNRKTHKAYNRVKEGNFDLQGLLGFSLHGKTIGIVGTGKIGQAFANIASGFGCRVLCYDPKPNAELNWADYTSLDELLAQSDIISLHCPLVPETQHMINPDTIKQMKLGVMLINTSRGGLIDTNALIKGLKTQQIGYVGLDVYEMEAELFFRDHSCEVIQDDLFQRLSTFHNVIITGHQGFFTQQALDEIANTTIKNIHDYYQDKIDKNTFL